MFRRSALPHALHVVEDGQEAINWLTGTGEYTDRDRFPLPDILILDLKMPVKGGFEVLQWMKEQSPYETIAAVILSSSDEQLDIKRGYELGAKNYFVKSPRLQDVMEYWRE